MPGIVVNPRSKIFHGHEWVYGTDIRKTFGNPQPGDVIALKDFKDRKIGSGIYNPHSQIVARRFSRRTQDLDLDFFRRRIGQAIARRAAETSIDPGLCRLVSSEGDGLPGLVIDRYDAHLVLQTLTLAMEQRIDLIVEALLAEAVPRPLSITARNDSLIRAAEGMGTYVKALFGDIPAPFDVVHGGLSFRVDPGAGQKTGLYLDQLANYALVAGYAAGRRVLDCFTHQGGFALASAMAGAEHVTGIDVSAGAIESARANAERSGLDARRIEFGEANVFDFLKQRDAAGERYGLIILDPPSFARNKRALGDALRGYKEIHLRALRMLDPGGILATYACSHHVDREALREVVVSAAVDAKRSLRQLAAHTQRADHPILPAIPETEYLKGFVFEVIPSW
ncbi:MAG TPA: class I SAM-dependent rRNA methyltransferase [Burkholderiales bacterium]|nr:class I SAM-dependent rRNA methyltransferase [Burkholderiales bacterium]